LPSSGRSLVAARGNTHAAVEDTSGRPESVALATVLCTLDPHCPVVSQETMVQQSELQEDVHFALRAKDRAILGLQVRAGEARRREAQLSEELALARQEVAELRGSLAEVATAAAEKEEAFRNSDEEVELLRAEVKEMKKRFEEFQHREDDKSWLGPCVRTEFVASHVAMGSSSPSLVTAMGSPSIQSSSRSPGSSASTATSLAMPQMVVASPWEVAELHGFLEALFGDMDRAVASLGDGRDNLGVSTFVAGLEDAGYAKDESLLLRLFVLLDTDGDGIVSAADLRRLPQLAL